jgi:uracil-DNA glycosylase family 4
MPLNFDPDCRRCPRLARFLDQVKVEYPTYHARPVAPFGDPAASLLIVGLAPGMHGANASGRPFTGDFAGILLYETLYRFGFSSAPQSVAADDGLRLRNCRITNAVKCLPPQNKPVGSEINHCNDFLKREIGILPSGGIIVALGAIAHQAVIKACGLRQAGFPFGHSRQHGLSGGIRLIDSYHCSRYNTQTRRLTPEMFHTVFAKARALIDSR